ncbi:hypothetical protein M2403_002053 [Rahnella sp. BIGb0603]|nr:hypothetical protein [Rahnella sp. BIGb0603]
MTWSGRSPIEAIMVLTIGMSLFWKCMIPVSALVTAWAVGRIALPKGNRWMITICTLLAICTINKNVFHDAALWIAGFYNYLLPISAAVISIVLYYKRKKSCSIAASILMAYSVSNEQIAVLFFVFFGYEILNAIIKKTNIRHHLIFFTLPIASSIVWLSSPGNASRFEVEKNFLLEFTDFSLLDKVSHGFATYANHTLAGNNYLLFFSCVAIVASSLINRNVNFISERRYVSFFFAFMAIFFVANKIYPLNFIFNNTDFNALTVDKIGGISTYVKYLISMVIAVTIIYYSFLSGFFRYGLFCIIGGMTVVVMVGLSPAIYAERPRVFFISDLLLIALCLRCFRR